MSDSNRTRLTYEKEIQWGIANPSPNMKTLRLDSESLTTNVQNIVSEEIRDDRQVTDLIQVAEDASGDTKHSLSFGSFDDFMEAALQSSGWSTPTDINETTIAATATGFTTGGDFTAEDINVGQIIKVEGFTNISINTFYRVVTIVSGAITTSPTPAATESAGNAVTMTGSYIRNGTTEQSFMIEKTFQDAAENFLYLGMEVDKMTMDLESQKEVKVGFSYMGKTGSVSATSIDLTPIAANSNEILNAVSDVGSIKEAGVEVSSPNYIRSLGLELSNNLRSQYAVGSDSAIGVGSGKCDVVGKLSTYFGNSDVMDKYLAGAKTSIDWTFTDPLGNSYHFDLPEIKFDSGVVTAQGQDQDVFAEMAYRAIMDAVYGFTIQITRF